MSEGLANCLLLALILSIAVNAFFISDLLDERKLEREKRRKKMKGNYFK